MIPLRTKALCWSVLGASVLLAACADQSATTIPKDALVRLVIAPKTALVSAIGDTIAFTASALDLRDSQHGRVERLGTPVWRSENPEIAAVEGNGVVRAITNGVARIVVMVGGQADTALVRVEQAAGVVVVTPSSSQLHAIGDTTRLRVTASDRNGVPMSGGPIYWESLDPQTGSIDASGLVTARRPGTIRLRARVGDVLGSAVIAVTQLVTTIRVAPSVASSPVGTLLTLAGSAHDALGSPVGNAVMSWASSNPSVASVSQSGVVTMLAAGNATITATSAGRSANSHVTVTPPAPGGPAPVATIVVSPGSGNLAPGSTLKLTAVLQDAQGYTLNGPVTWSSSNPSVASVSGSGLVTAVASGTTTITASNGGKAGVALITVSSTPPPAERQVGSVSLEPSSAIVSVNGIVQLRAVVRDTDGDVMSGQTVVFASSAPSVASVGLNGRVKGLTPGAATITVTSGGKTGSAAITVVPLAPQVGSVTVTPNSTALVVGAVTQLDATVKDTNGTVMSASVVWSSSAPSVASVAPDGTVTAHAAGIAMIKATSGGKAASAAVTVSTTPPPPPPPPPVGSVTVTPSTASLAADATLQLSATVRDTSGAVIPEQPVTWTTSNANIALVSADGLVTAVSAGNAIITASSGGKNGMAQINVAGAPGVVQVASVAVTPTVATLAIDSTLKLTAIAKDANGNVLSGQPVIWSSSNTNVATVNINGFVTALAAGSAVITAASGGKNGVAHITVPSNLKGADPARGASIWSNECAQCHTSPQGWDLAHFGYSDTTIIRRALGHVSQSAATDIVAHVRSLPSADTMSPASRPFQPGGIVLSSDQEFGLRLFGSDQWPATLTRTQLLAMDPRTIPVALPLPVWSDETSAYDWLPGSTGTGQLPAGVRQASQALLDAYYSRPSLSAATAAAMRIRTAAHDPSIPDAPCTYLSDVNRYDAQKCADVAKWGASLIYVEGIRAGDVAAAGVSGTNDWWETGHMFHKAQQFKRPLPDRDLQIAGWIYLGWMWNRALNKNSLYGAGPLDQMGLNRHVTWVVLRTMVERRADSTPLCADVETLAQWGETRWMHNALTLAYNELQFRAATGQLADRSYCAEQVRLAQVWVNRRIGAAAAAALQPLADATTTAIWK